jgi:hypothetical protein
MADINISVLIWYELPLILISGPSLYSYIAYWDLLLLQSTDRGRKSPLTGCRQGGGLEDVYLENTGEAQQSMTNLGRKQT